MAALARLNDDDRAFAPFRIRPTDHRNKSDAGIAPDDVFDFGWVYPFAAGFDEILGATCDREVSVLIDRGKIAGIEIAFGIERACLVLKVALDDACALHLEMAHHSALLREG